MPHIFRRIRKQLFNEGDIPSYVYFIISEMLLVILGILIALQIDNWNDDRKDRAKEQLILSELHSEFLQNKAQLEAVVNGHWASYRDIHWVINQFPIDPERTDLDSLNHYLFNLQDGACVLGHWTFNPSNTSIDALSKSGTFDIITNNELRKKLLSWESILKDYLEEEEAMIQFLIETLVPYFRERGALTPAGLRDPRVDISFLASPEFESYLYNRRYTMFIILEPSFAGMELDLDKLSQLIDDIIRLTE